MGYSHYYFTRREADMKPRAVIEDIGALTDAWPLPLERTIDRAGICVNGAGDEQAEAFAWPPDMFEQEGQPQEWFYEFVKTNRCDYDPVVVASLIAVKHHLGDDVVIDTDGDIPDEWADGIALYVRTFPMRDDVVAPTIAAIQRDVAERREALGLST